MIARLKMLCLKEYKLQFRNYESFMGIVIFNALVTVLICALFRNLQLTPKEVGLIACPYLWLILVLSIFRLLLQNLSEESRKGLFLKQLRDGFSSTEIFLAKFLSGLLLGFVIITIQTLVFLLLMGHQEILTSVIGLGVVYAISLPSLVSLSIIGACISHRSSYEEVLMPIILLPLILLLSLAVVSQGELIFIDINSQPKLAIFESFNSYWFKLVLGLQLVLVLVSELLFRVISRIKG